MRRVVIEFTSAQEKRLVPWQDRCENAARKRIRGVPESEFHPHVCVVCGAPIGVCCGGRLWNFPDENRWACAGKTTYLDAQGNEVEVVRGCQDLCDETATRERLRAKGALGKR